MDSIYTVVVGWTREQEDGIVTMPKLFDKGREGGEGPTFLVASAAWVDGDALVAGMMHGMLCRFERQFIGYLDVMEPNSLREVCNDVCVLPFWWASGCDNYFADAYLAQFLFEYAFGIA